MLAQRYDIQCTHTIDNVVHDDHAVKLSTKSMSTDASQANAKDLLDKAPNYMVEKCTNMTTLPQASISRLLLAQRLMQHGCKYSRSFCHCIKQKPMFTKSFQLCVSAEVMLISCY